MVSFEKARVVLDFDGKRIAKVDLQVSTVSELPSMGAMVGEYCVAAGSIAQVIQNGKWYTMDATGTWYDEDGNAAGG